MAETAVQVKCSKCGATLDATGYPKWCRQCRQEYKQTYEAGKLNRSEAKGFRLGVAAMRDLLADEFAKFGAAGFNGDEIEALIRQAPGPMSTSDNSDD